MIADLNKSFNNKLQSTRLFCTRHISDLEKHPQNYCDMMTRDIIILTILKVQLIGMRYITA